MASVSKEKVRLNCKLCQTTHSNEYEYKNHIAGKKHRQKVEIERKQNKLLEQRQIYEKRGIFIGNLPHDTDPNELLMYIGNFGHIEQSTTGTKFFKVLFKDEQSADNFRKSKHVYKNRHLLVDNWKLHSVGNSAEEVEKKERQLCDQLTWRLAKSSSIEEQVCTLTKTVALSMHRASLCQRLCYELWSDLVGLYGRDLTVHMFGSVITGLGFCTSDLDVVLDTNLTLQRYVTKDVHQVSHKFGKKEMNKVAQAIKKHFTGIVVIATAKIPIIKCFHQSTHFNCDISFANVTGVQNSCLIQWYVDSDVRVKQLLIILKYWAKYFQIAKPPLSNYALVIMGLYYLMQLESPIIPPVIKLQQVAKRQLYIDQWNCSFDHQCNYVTKSSNNSSILELLKGFFVFYAQFDYGMYVICPLIGKAVPKFLFLDENKLSLEFGSNQLNKSEALQLLSKFRIKSNICVQDPFILDRNITSAIKSDLALKIQRLFECSAFVLGEDCVSQGTIGFLAHLLKPRTSDLVLVPEMWKWPLSNNFELTINVDCFVPSIDQNVCDVTVDKVQYAWYEQVYSVVKNDIFGRMFLFKVTECGNSPYKKCKIDPLKTNTMKQEMPVESRSVTCRREGHDLCSNRKVIMKEMEPDQTKTWIEQQEAVTSHLMKVNTPNELTHFMCCFHFLKCPTRVVLELYDLGSSNNGFKVWVSYLEAHLAGWLTELMSDTTETNDASATSKKRVSSNSQ